MTEATIHLEITKAELLFLEKLLRLETNFVTEEEGDARARLSQKIPRAAEPGGVDLVPAEAMFLKKVIQTSYSFIVRGEKFAREGLRDRFAGLIAAATSPPEKPPGAPGSR